MQIMIKHFLGIIQASLQGFCEIKSKEIVFAIFTKPTSHSGRRLMGSWIKGVWIMLSFGSYNQK